MPKIRGRKRKSSMLGYGKKDNSWGIYDELIPGASCDGGSCGRDNPCESGCHCVGGSSGGDWEGNCDSGGDMGHQLYSQGGGYGGDGTFGCPSGTWLCPGGGACLPGCKKYHDPDGEQCLGGGCSAGQMKMVAQNFIDMYMPGYDGSIMSVMDCVSSDSGNAGGGLHSSGCQETCCSGPHSCCMSIA